MKHCCILLTTVFLAPLAALQAADDNADRSAVVTKTPGHVTPAATSA